MVAFPAPRPGVLTVSHASSRRRETEHFLVCVWDRARGQVPS